MKNKIRFKKIVFFLLVTSLFPIVGECTKAQGPLPEMKIYFERMNQRTYPVTRFEDIVVFYTQKPKRPYIKIGKIRVSSSYWPQEKLIDRIKAEASVRGANAVIDVKTETSSVFEKTDYDSMAYAKFIAEGVAIRWK